MNERWFTLNSDGWHNLVIGLLRDRQYEMALDKLEQMQLQEVQIQPWLYDIFIFLFCESEEFDEALKILHYRVETGDMDISPNVWYMVLDVCSRNYHVSSKPITLLYKIANLYCSTKELNMCGRSALKSQSLTHLMVCA